MITAYFDRRADFHEGLLYFMALEEEGVIKVFGLTWKSVKGKLLKASITYRWL